ncbi:hypothetical protein DXT99_06050 [Pontibacter diazotrophicus]|uniref:Uncharacterized protein n=1 Tax=Pontibacter diazotrophicus TaxID=1400979 RepID=A0A3D8LFP5_9BACT|nr:hypothetical protein [Pontibacter diazotrophicus]RDV16230.1 hypothetical protein DXT99_06050 [Pontibacter diazotrophicus]
MKDNAKQYNGTQVQSNVPRTFIRQGWIPTVVQIQNKENRNWQMEHQPMQHQRLGSRNIRRKQNWVAWPQI